MAPARLRLFWTWKSRHRTGRPAVPHDIRALIRDMSPANPVLGAPRIHGELLKSGISVSQSTVATYMRRHPRLLSQTWRTFLTNHASQIMAADFFVAPTITFRVLFELMILAHDRRRIVDLGHIQHPPGRRSKFGTSFRKTRRRGISSTIVIRSLQTWRSPSAE